MHTPLTFHWSLVSDRVTVTAAARNVRTWRSRAPRDPARRSPSTVLPLTALTDGSAYSVEILNAIARSSVVEKVDPLERDKAVSGGRVSAELPYEVMERWRPTFIPGERFSSAAPRGSRPVGPVGKRRSAPAEVTAPQNERNRAWGASAVARVRNRCRSCQGNPAGNRVVAGEVRASDRCSARYIAQLGTGATGTDRTSEGAAQSDSKRSF